MAATTPELEPAPDLDPVPAAHLASVAEVCRQISAGERAASELSAEQRQRCVEHLTEQGFTTDEIAQLLDIHQRTVRRDRTTLRQQRAMPPDVHLGDELMGEFERITLASIGRLTRMVRDPETPAYARLWAEEAMSRMYHRLIDTARRLQYVDTGQARLKHQRETDPDEQQRWVEQRQAELGKVMKLLRG